MVYDDECKIYLMLSLGSDQMNEKGIWEKKFLQGYQDTELKVTA